MDYERYYKESLPTDIKAILAGFGKSETASVIPDESFDLFEKDRELVKRALAGTIGNIVSHLNLTNALEVGSGKGGLAKFLQVAGIDPSQVEYSDVDIDRLRKNLPEGTTASQLDIADLTKAPQTRTAIISLNTLDMFPNAKATLDQELTAIREALVPGGVFVHFEDLLPDEFTLYRRYPDSIILPAFNSGNITELPFYILTKEEAIKFGEHMKRNRAYNLSAYWKTYIELDPVERAIAHRGDEQNGFGALLHNYLQYAKNIHMPKPKSIDLAKEFPQYMTGKLQKLGFVTNATLVTNTIEGKPKEDQEPGTIYRYAFSSLKTQKDSRLGENVRETVSVLIIMGQKTK